MGQKWYRLLQNLTEPKSIDTRNVVGIIVVFSVEQKL